MKIPECRIEIWKFLPHGISTNRNETVSTSKDKNEE